MLKIYFQGLFLLLCLTISTQAKDYIFSGIIVDKNGKPLPEVTVYIEPKIAIYQFDKWILTAETDNQGHFQLVKQANEGDVFYLELNPPPLAYTYFPIRPPFFKGLEKNSTQLFQRKITLGKSLNIDVGKITGDFPYSTLNVKFVHKDGNLALGYETNFSMIWLKILDKNGEFVGGDNFANIQDKTGFDINSEYQISLPNGKWQIKLCADEYCKKVIGISGLINIKEETPKFEVVINE